MRLFRPKVTSSHFSGFRAQKWFSRKSNFFAEKLILGGISSRFSFVFKGSGAICAVGGFLVAKNDFHDGMYVKLLEFLKFRKIHFSRMQKYFATIAPLKMSDYT